MRSHTTERRSKTKSRKFTGYCEECNKSICSCKAYSYVDESNASITNNSPYLCKDCYEKKYNVHIADETEAFRNELIETLQRIQYDTKVETIRIDNLIEYIRKCN